MYISWSATAGTEGHPACWSSLHPPTDSKIFKKDAKICCSCSYTLSFVSRCRCTGVAGFSVGRGQKSWCEGNFKALLLSQLCLTSPLSNLHTRQRLSWGEEQHQLMGDAFYKNKNAIFVCMVWAGQGEPGRAEYALHGPCVNSRSTRGGGRPCGGAHGLDRSLWQWFSDCTLHYIVILAWQHI